LAPCSRRTAPPPLPLALRLLKACPRGPPKERNVTRRYLACPCAPDVSGPVFEDAVSVSCRDVGPWPAAPAAGPRDAETLLTRRALITGITGQDGSYLAEYLVAEGYEVWGLVRGQANPRVRRVRQLLGDVRLVRGDLLDQGSLISAVERVQPDEVYNLAAISYVPMSWQQAELTGEVTGLGVLRVLEAIRVCSGISPSRTPSSGQIRFYQASSSEMFGMVAESPQTERTPFHPRSPYGVAKAYGHFLTQNYRESYGMFAVSGILFNHESPRRGPE